MKPQTDAFLEKAAELLRQAETMLGVDLTDAAGRTAYLAGFHAAQGYLFEQADKVFKTHKGVQTEFNRLVKDDPRFDIELRIFLGKTYNLKAIADYETGPGAKISKPQASEAIAVARRFIGWIAVMIGSEALTIHRIIRGPDLQYVHRCMKPETALFLVKARELLDKSEALYGDGQHEKGGNVAYYAGFEIARAFIFERSDKIVTSDDDLHAEFAKAAKDEPAVSKAANVFLLKGEGFKATAAYQDMYSTCHRAIVDGKAP